MRKSSHAAYDICYHIVFSTRNQKPILVGNLALRVREILKLICDEKDIIIIKGHIKPNYVRLLVSCPTTLSPMQVVQYIKGRSSKMLHEEFSDLDLLWATGYFCQTVGTITDEPLNYFKN